MASLFKKREYESVHPDDHTLCDVKPRAPLQYVSALMHLGCVLLGLGVGWVIGFNTCSDVSSSCWLAAPLSTIPAEVAWPRTPKAFNPDERYIGPSKEVDDQWRSLVGKYKKDFTFQSELILERVSGIECYFRAKSANST